MRAGHVVLAVVLAVAVALVAWAAADPSGVDWGTASFVWVGALVLVGIAAYGLRVVPAHELSLVAALAAFATASRVLFASLPNVKPVTFVVLVSGVGLGPGPGFMVGATTALVSNFFFGQGPWTPWQMLDWGAVGGAGGLLGRRGRRSHADGAGHTGAPSRWTLVVVGAISALAFDWTVTLYMVIPYSAHTTGAIVALYGRGLPFDVAHAAATAFFCALFGEQAVAIVARFRSRTHVTFLDLEATP